MVSERKEVRRGSNHPMENMEERALEDVFSRLDPKQKLFVEV